MGSMYFRAQQAKEAILSKIVKGEAKYLVALVGVNIDTGEPAKGAYRLFKDLDEKAIKEYATMVGLEEQVNVQSIEVYSLDAKLTQKLEPPYEK